MPPHPAQKLPPATLKKLVEARSAIARHDLQAALKLYKDAAHPAPREPGGHGRTGAPARDERARRPGPADARAGARARPRLVGPAVQDRAGAPAECRARPGAGAPRARLRRRAPPPRGARDGHAVLRASQQARRCARLRGARRRRPPQRPGGQPPARAGRDPPQAARQRPREAREALRQAHAPGRSAPPVAHRAGLRARQARRLRRGVRRVRPRRPRRSARTPLVERVDGDLAHRRLDAYRGKMDDRGDRAVRGRRVRHARRPRSSSGSRGRGRR
jgi:hypothetical protein